MRKAINYFVLMLVAAAITFSFTYKPYLVSTEKIRVTQGSDLAAIPETTADMLVVVDRATAITNGTMPMPANPVDYQTFMVSSRCDIVNMTLNSNGKAVYGTVGTLYAGDMVAWTFDATSNAWFRTANPTGIDPDKITYRALGSSIISETVGQKLPYANTASNLVDGQIRYMAVPIPMEQTITGLKVYVRTAGSYTGDNNNKVGLYSYNTSTGLLTLVASSANSSTLWTSAANAVQTINFTTPYLAAPAVYYAALLYNQSAQTTAPALASGVALNNAAMAGTAYGFANSGKLLGTSSSTDLPATINISAISASAIPTWVATF